MREARKEKFIRAAFKGLDEAEYWAAERSFKLTKCHGGLALMAFLTDRPERGAIQALKSLEDSEECFPYEREVALQVLRLCWSSARKKIEERFTQKMEKKLSGVDWKDVEKKLTDLAKSNSSFSLLCPEVVSARAGREEMKEALELVREGSLGRACEFLAKLSENYPCDEFLGYGWATALGGIEWARKNFGPAFELAIADLLEKGKDLMKSREKALLLGLWIFNFGLYFKRRNEKKSETFMRESLKCFEFAAGLGERSSFLWATLGHCHELLGDHGRAIRYYKTALEAGVPEEKTSVWHALAESRAELCAWALKKDLLLSQYPKVIARARKAHACGKKKRELRLLESALEIRPQEFGTLAPEIAKLRVDLRREVWPDLIRAAIARDPKNELLLKYAVKRGTKLLKKNPEKALLYFRVVPKEYDDPEFLRKYAEALESVKRYDDAGKLYRRLGPRDPPAFFQALRCTFLVGKRDATVENLKDLFAFCADIAILERALKLAEKLGKEEVTLDLCQRLLTVDPSNPTAVAVWEKIQLKRKSELLAGYKPVKASAEGMFNRKDYRGTVAQLSKIPVEFMDGPAMEMMARSLRELGRYREAFEWYQKLPEDAEQIASMVFCLLMEKEYERAMEWCGRLLEKDEPGALLEEIWHPDVRGLVLERLGEYDKALEEYRGEELLLRLASKAREARDARREIMCFEKLYRISSSPSYKEVVKKMVLENEDRLTVAFKSKTSVEGVEMVVCDTNVFFSVLLSEVDLPEPLKSMNEGGERAAEKFRGLSAKCKMVMTPTVERELRGLCRGNFEKLKETQAKPIFQKLEELVEKHGLKEPTVEGDGWLSKAIRFYEQYPEKLHEITERKIKMVPHDEVKLLKKRAGRPFGDFRLWDYSLSNPLPEMADMKLLAECLKLSNSCIPGVHRISLFSEDSDFREFAGEIFKEFGIRVYY